MGGNAGDVDDAAFAARDHCGTEFLARQKYAADEIQIEIGVPRFERDFFEWIIWCGRHLGVIAAGGIDENAPGSERFFDGLVRSLEAFFFYGVAVEKRGGAAFVLDGFDA